MRISPDVREREVLVRKRHVVNIADRISRRVWRGLENDNAYFAGLSIQRSIFEEWSFESVLHVLAVGSLVIGSRSQRVEGLD